MKRLALLTTTASLLLPAAPAAAGEVSYDVTFTGSGAYHQRFERVLDEDNSELRTTSLEFGWQSRFEDVRFRDGQLVEPVRDLIPTVWMVGGHREEHRVQPTPFSVDCAFHDEDAGEGLLTSGLDLDAGAPLVVRPAGALTGTFRCADPERPDEHWHPAFDVQSPGTGLEPALPGEAPLDAVVGLPREAIGMGQIVERVGRQERGERCPAQDVTGYTVDCSIAWEGEIVMVRSDRVRETPGVSAAVVRGGRGVVLEVRCQAACRGTLFVMVRDARRELQTILHVPYAAGPGRAATIRRAVPRRWRAQVARTGRVRVRTAPR